MKPVGTKEQFSDGKTFPITLVADQLRANVPGGIGVYGLGLLQGFREIAADFDPGDQKEISNHLSFSLLASKSKATQSGTGDRLKDFLLLSEGKSAMAAPPFSLQERFSSSLFFIYAAKFGLIKVPAKNLLACISLVVPKSKGPTCVTLHDLAFRDLPESFTPHGVRWHESALKRALKRADGFIAPTSGTAARIKDLAGPTKPVAVIEYGCDHLPPPNLDETRALLERLSIPAGRGKSKLLLAVGTIEPRKNLDRLLQAFSLAEPSLDEGTSLLVIGPQGWGDSLPQLPKNVYLTGSLPGDVLAGLYETADALLYVPILEGYGLPVAEAFHAGLPVISSPVPSAKGATYLADPLSIEDIAEKITSLLKDEDLRTGLIAKGKEIAEGLTWRSIAFQHLLFWQYLYGRYFDILNPVGLKSQNMTVEQLDKQCLQISYRQNNITHKVKILN